MLRDAKPGYLARRPGFVIFRYQNKLLDSIKLAEILNQGHETAKADRYFVRNMDKIVDINSSGLELILQRIYNIQNPVAKANLINQKILEFCQMLE